MHLSGVDRDDLAPHRLHNPTAAGRGLSTRIHHTYAVHRMAMARKLPRVLAATSVKPGNRAARTMNSLASPMALKPATRSAATAVWPAQLGDG